MTSPDKSQDDNKNASHRTTNKEKVDAIGTDVSPDEIAVEEFCITVAWIYLLSISNESKKGEDEEE